MKNEFNLFPRDFKKAHDKKSKEYMKSKNKKQLEEIKRFNKLLKQMRQNITEDDPLAIKTAELFIRLPASLGELTKEGEALHHCVGTYKERVAKGQTMIYFIRRIEEPDKPYFTLEYRKGEIVQCRGFDNCDMTPEVKAFVNIFREKMQEYQKDCEKVG